MLDTPPLSTGTGHDSIPSHLDDAALATWLANCLTHKHQVGYLQDDHICKVVDLTDPEGELHGATPETESKEILKKLCREGLLQHSHINKSILHAAYKLDESWTFVPLTTWKETHSLVDDLLTALGRGKGRGKEISDRTAQEVWADAAGRCMFAGCGDDLTSIPFYKKRARVGYLAHIVASSPQGPRGSQALSHKLADDSSNIMLMCDKHHRLIDCHAPMEYPVERLQAMREAHIAMVHHLLESLKYKRVKAVAILGNLANTSTFFSENDFRSALLEDKKSLVDTVRYLGHSSKRDERNYPGFWANYLREHEGQIRYLVSDSNDAAAHPLPLAVFPFHNIPTLVLAGRIMGEGRVNDVFQYHRERKSWAWDTALSPKPQHYFSVEGLSDSPEDEVFISIELTAELDLSALPTELETRRLPWIRIRCQQPSFDCIAHPDDLKQFSDVARQAINHVQDKMRVSRVHTIAISPASTVYRFGQMLQAGHHPTYVLYDRADRTTPFAPTLVITGQDVSAVDDPATPPRSISIR